MSACGNGPRAAHPPATLRDARAAIRAAARPAASAASASAKTPQHTAACGARGLPTSLRHPKVSA